MNYEETIEQPIFLSAGDIQKIIPLSRAGVYSLLHHKRCPTIRVGKRLMVERKEFLSFIQSLKDNKEVL